MSEQILKTEVRLFRDSSISQSTSMFVANQMIVKSVKVKSVLFIFFKGNYCTGFCQYLKAVMVKCISKQSAVAEKVYIGVKWAVNLSEK